MPDSEDPLNPFMRVPLAVPATGAPYEPKANSFVAPASALDIQAARGARSAPMIRKVGPINPTGTRNLSVPVFYPGFGQRLPELLQALPMVKGAPLLDVGKTTTKAAKLTVQVQRPSSAGTVQFYDATLEPADQVDSLDDTIAPVELARIGQVIKALALDAATGFPGTGANPVDWQFRAATVQVLRQIDSAIGGTAMAGAGAEPFESLVAQATSLSRTATTTGNIEQDARRLLTEIYPTGTGAGEGPDCLIGGPYVLRTLMSTPSGQSGQSGWRRDARTGLNIYHWMGIPFYRTNTEEDTGTGSPLLAANLGPTGVCLVHGYGTPESYGLQVDQNPFQSTTGMRELLVHGAFGIAIWEPEAIFCITDTPTPTAYP